MKKKAHYSGLSPTPGWQARNYKFFRHRIIPQLFREPTGSTYKPNKTPPAEGSARLTWIGHASFYLQFHNRSLLIDPVWGKWLGFIKRQQVPGLCLDSMPPVDLVLVSHAHADHLHRHTLRQIQSRQGIVVPTGSGNLVSGLGMGQVQEVKVWEVTDKDGITVLHTPSHHWGARYGTDTYRDYGGYIVSYNGLNIYHAGDSAYFEGFREIREHFEGPIHVALLPIGAYDAPSGRNVHISPEEAIQAFLDLEAEVMLPMHHDTFPLGNEDYGEAEARLIAEAARLNLSDRVIIPKPGEEFVKTIP